MGVYAHIDIYLSIHISAMNIKQRGDSLRTTISQVRAGTFDYTRREEPKRDWNLYDQAQTEETILYVENTRLLVDIAWYRICERYHTKKRKPGRPRTPPDSVTKVMLVQEYFGHPNRVAEGDLHLLREKLHVKDDFSYKTIERGFDDDVVRAILFEVLRVTNESVKGDEVSFTFDGNGYSTSSKAHYSCARELQNASRKRKKSKDAVAEGQEEPADAFPQHGTSRKDFVYQVLGVGVKHKLISGVAISVDHSVGETTLFPDVFAQTKELHPDMKEAMGDGIYGVRPCVDVVSSSKATPYFLPRSNVTFKSKGCAGWGPMLMSLQKGPQDWLTHYYTREMSETVNSMISFRFGTPIRQKLDKRKDTAALLRDVAHNIRRMGYLEIIEGIKVDGKMGGTR